MEKLALILALFLLAACSGYGADRQIPMAGGVPLYGTAGIGHAL